MSEQPIALANPGNREAQQALQRYQDGRKLPRGNDQLIFPLGIFAACSMFIMPDQGSKLVVLGFFAMLAIVGGAITLGAWRRQRAYQHHVDAGDIITLDPHLIHVWNELFAEAGHQPECWQRHTSLGELFYAARDLAPELAARAKALADEDTDAELLAQARIRVRLLQQARPILDTLTAQSETQQQIAQLTPDWADQAEVDEQLALLRARETADNPTSEEPAQHDAGQREPAPSTENSHGAKPDTA